MTIDLNRCVGCQTCTVACKHANDTLPEVQWRRVLDVETGTFPDVQRLFLVTGCQHCAEPPCVDVCPTGASFVRDDGIVLVDKHICIGCRYCMMACPYKARSFIHEELSDQRPHAPRGKGTVESCTFCVHRVDRGRTPACVEACSEAGHGALIFGDMKDANSELAKRLEQVPNRQVREDLGLDTGVRYHGI